MTAPRDPLYPHARAMFCNADPLWQGAPNTDSAVIEYGDGFLVLTPEHGADGTQCYVLGVYTASEWTDGEGVEHVTYVDVHREGAGVMALVDYLTEPPEGVDPIAWACQRLADDGEEADRVA